MSDIKIGFLLDMNFEKNSAYRGAILITDCQTRPLEFHVTSPIKPTRLQKTLYGEILGEQILVELMTIPLIRSLKEKPSIILVRNPLFLRANLKQDIRIVRLNTEDGSNFNKPNENISSNSINGKHGHILLETSKEFQSELSEIQKKLSNVYVMYNLFEPFDRLRNACKEVHAQRLGDSEQ